MTFAFLCNFNCIFILERHKVCICVGAVSPHQAERRLEYRPPPKQTLSWMFSSLTRASMGSVITRTPNFFLRSLSSALTHPLPSSKVMTSVSWLHHSAAIRPSGEHYTGWCSLFAGRHTITQNLSLQSEKDKNERRKRKRENINSLGENKSLDTVRGLRRRHYVVEQRWRKSCNLRHR